jgi:hypothetical protein
VAGGLALIAVAVALVLSRSPPELARGNGIAQVNTVLATVPGSGSGCQSGETLPAGTTAIRLSLESSAGPRVAVAVRSGASVLTRGESEPGWLADVVTVPVRRVARAASPVVVCFAFHGAHERVSFLGVPTPRNEVAHSSLGPLAGRIAIEYLRPGSSSRWSRVHDIARHMGLGRAWAGTWVVALVAALMASAIALASWLAVREPR